MKKLIILLKITTAIILLLGFAVQSHSQPPDPFPGTALDFDGIDDYVDCGNDASLNITGTNITIEAWIYPTDFKSNFWENTIVGKDYCTGDGTESGYTLSFGDTGGDLNFIFGTGTAWVDISALNVLTLDSWQHISVVYDGSKMELYVNGELVASQNQTSSIASSLSNFCIGESPGDPGNRNIAGKVDEVRLWNIARDSTQIRENMYMALSGSETGLVSYWQFNDGSGTITEDIISGNDGTLTNMDEVDWVTSTAPLPFTSTQDGTWANAATWLSGQGAPIHAWSRVSINHIVTLNVDRTAINCEIKAGKNLSIATGNTLTISDSIINTGTQSGDGLVKLSGGDSACELNGIYGNIKLDDTDGATLTGDLTINGTLTLTSGTFLVGANTLILKNALAGTATNLSAGSTSSITIAGSGSGVNIPASVTALNHFMLNNTNGTTLQNSLQVDGTLTLTSGAITLNSQTLSYSSIGTLKYNGSSPQTTSAAEFPDTNGPNSLIIDNANGLSLAFDRTINNTLTLTDGALSIGSNTLVLNGALSTTSGSLTGGLSSNITFGGSGASTDLPAVSLNNLTINRSNGIGFGGDVTVNGTLTLTSGTFMVGANTLTLKNALAGTATNLSAGSTSSIFIAGSGSGVNIPGSVTVLNHFTLNNTNGTSLQNNLQVDGTLTLTDGALSIGSNTLTLIGALSISSGSLTGGSSSNITFGGFGASTDLPAVSLNNLTINRSNGIGLGGNVTVNGTLILISGTFMVGANTLTLKNALTGTTTNLSAGSTSSITIAGSGSGVNIPGSVTVLNHLTLNNTNGTTLQNSLQLDGTLTLTDGALSIGSNTLMLNGVVSTTSGSMTGSLSSNITFGGSGASTDLPAVSLNNLTINRGNGIGLGGDVVVNDTLTLTNGTFTVGPNTLTYKNAIAGTSTNLSCNNTSSITISGNSTGIIIPSHIIELNSFTLDNTNGTTLQNSLQLAGALTLTNGAVTIGTYTLTLNGAVSTSSGSLSGGSSSNIVFGGSGASTNLPSVMLNNLTINRVNGIGLSGEVTIDGTVTLTNGSLSLNGYNITLGASAVLSESEGNTVTGSSGTITTTRTFNAGDLSAGVNIAGLGAKITTTQALGSTTITRGHHSQSSSILRYFDINSTNNSSLNAELVFNYDDSELNSNVESELKLYRSTDSGSNWALQGGTVDVDNETITLSGIDAFSRWTAFGTKFTQIVSLTGVSQSSVAWGDYDNDGDLDILLTGLAGISYISYIYRNDGSGIFTDINAGLPGVWWSSVAWGDYDNDGDLDILLTGDSDNGYISYIYRNDSSDTFTDIVAGFPGVGAGSVAWGDYDNDGDLDILLTGDSDYGIISYIYRNDGSDTFTHVGSLTGVKVCSVAWGDYDNDGDLDVLLTGLSDNGNISYIYRNDGSDTFTHVVSLTGVANSSVAWGDYDNDGDLDILMTGGNNNGYISYIYRNDGSGIFTDIVAGLPGVDAGSVAWGDYDNDGDLDFLLTGDSENGIISYIYRNDGSDTFTHVGSLTGVFYSSVAWGDYDNDGDLDILLTGLDKNSHKISYIYRNDIISTNTIPNTPANLSASPSGTGVTLTWDKSTDNETAQNGLTYNLRLGTSSGGVQSLSPMANISNGYRRVPALGNTNHNNNWDIYGLIDNSTYYWSVQAVDNAFAGSAFATEGSFVIPDYPNISTTSITNITTTTASSGGNVTDEGTFPVTVKGIVWDTCKKPTVDTYTGKTNNGSGLGSFISSLTGLTGGQTYYVRAYATNSECTAYGGQKVFATPMIPPGNALDFDGIDDYVETSLNDLSGSEITIEYWFKGSSTQSAVRQQNGDYIVAGWNDLHIISTDGGTGNGIAVGTGAEDGNWHHIAMSWQQNTVNGFKSYLDGNFVAQRTSSDISLPNIDANVILGSISGTQEFMYGTLDEVRIWNIARDSVQIRENMHRTLNGVEANLVAYYRFDHISGTALSDRTSNDNDGTLINMDDWDWLSSTAPIPYFTVYDGNWEVDSVWAAGQNAPVYQWSRAKIKHNITLNSNMELIEMIIDTNAIMTISTGNTLTVGGE